MGDGRTYLLHPTVPLPVPSTHPTSGGDYSYMLGFKPDTINMFQLYMEQQEELERLERAGLGEREEQRRRMEMWDRMGHTI